MHFGSIQGQGFLDSSYSFYGDVSEDVEEICVDYVYEAIGAIANADGVYADLCDVLFGLFVLGPFLIQIVWTITLY